MKLNLVDIQTGFELLIETYQKKYELTDIEIYKLTHFIEEKYYLKTRRVKN